MEQIKVSFIIPAYNVADYIGACIESVLAQDIEKEIIIVNDGSTDKTGEIAKEYAKENKCIRIIDKENRGLSCARNDGAALARGEYLCFIDGDDYCLEDFSADFYRLCKLYRLDLIRGWYARCYPDGRTEKAIYPVTFLNRPMKSIDYLAASVYEKALEVVAVACFIRRNFILEQGLKFEEGLYYEDQLFFLKMLLSSGNCTVMQVDRCIYGYRMREGSITSTPNIRKASDLVRIMRKQIEFADSLNLDKYYKTAADRVVSASMVHLISLYLRLSPKDQIKIIRRIPGRLKLRALRNSNSFRDFLKILIFTFCPKLLVRLFDTKEKAGLQAEFIKCFGVNCLDKIKRNHTGL